jgi:hypothetical protein
VTQDRKPLRTCDNSRKANQVKELTAAVTLLNAQIEALKTQNAEF